MHLPSRSLGFTPPLRNTCGNASISTVNLLLLFNLYIGVNIAGVFAALFKRNVYQLQKCCSERPPLV